MIFFVVFFGLAVGFLAFISYALWLVQPVLVWTVPIYWALMILGNDYAVRVMLSLDQGWQVLVSPWLNLWKHPHRFGAPDETASSVLGKNLEETGLFRYKACEFVLSWVFEGGKPHSVRAIEDDEGR